MVQASVNYCDAAAAKTYLKAKDYATGKYTRPILEAMHGTTPNNFSIKNTSSHCAFRVGAASYKAFQHYTQSVKTQQYYASAGISLRPGQTWTYTLKVPRCTYQVDLFQGQVLTNFKTTTYSQQGRLLSAWYFPGNAQQQGQLPVCQPKPTPTPTRPTPTPTLRPTYTPTPNPTVIGVSITPTPPTKLPDTGPGLAVVMSLLGVVGGLLTKKFGI